MQLIKGGSNTIIGVLEYAPELRYSIGGKAICTFRIANLKTLEHTNCESWEKIAEEIIEADLKSQNIISVKGYPKVREYDGKKYNYFVVQSWKFEVPF